MPFTPYHVGPASALGIIFKNTFDIPALLVSSIALDIEPLTIILFNLDYPLHGFLHNFWVGSAVAFLVAVVMYFMKGTTKPVMAVLKLDQDSSFPTILLSSFVGVYSHVILDSILYSEMRPFYPLDSNPLYLKFNINIDITEFCLFCYAVATSAYIVRLYLRKRFKVSVPP